MATEIQWADDVWNYIVGCGENCRYCYAVGFAIRHGKNKKLHQDTQRAYRHVIADGKWNGKTACNPSALDKPLRRKKPTRYFVNSMGDLGHNGSPYMETWLDKMWDVMSLCPQHTFLILTKDPAQIKINIKDLGVLPNVWIGVTAENQAMADERIPLLLEISSAVHFVSLEPLSGDVDLTRIVLEKSDAPERDKPDLSIDSLFGWCGGFKRPNPTKISWIIVGAEKSRRKNKRPMDPAWVDSIRKQCAESNTPFFGKVDSDGNDIMPREFPINQQRNLL